MVTARIEYAGVLSYRVQDSELAPPDPGVRFAWIQMLDTVSARSIVAMNTDELTFLNLLGQTGWDIYSPAEDRQIGKSLGFSGLADYRQELIDRLGWEPTFVGVVRLWRAKRYHYS